MNARTTWHSVAGGTVRVSRTKLLRKSSLGMLRSDLILYFIQKIKQIDEVPQGEAVNRNRMHCSVMKLWAPPTYKVRAKFNPNEPDSHLN
jgi:hypothetical protein